MNKVYLLLLPTFSLALFPGCGEVQSAADDSGIPDANTGGDGQNASPDAGPTCPPGEICQTDVNFMFVTSTVTTGAELGGLAGGDALCNQRAAAASLPGNYVAWLSTDTVNAIDRLGAANGWIRTDRRPVAIDKEALADEEIIYPPYLNEFGVPASADVLTGSDASGMTGGANCTGWTSSAGVGGVNKGSANSVSREWTDDRTIACDVPASIYCFGTDHDNGFETPIPAEGRLAWVSRNTVSPGTGIAEMDAICNTEANDAGLVSAKALLALSTESAASRFDLDRPTWVRPDGALLWTHPSELATKPPLTAIFVQTDAGSIRSLVWTGAGDTNMKSDGIVRRNCIDWQENDNGNRAIVGSTSKTGPDFFDTFGATGTGCGNPNARIYCLEE